jgi:hypothetical protein
MIALHMNLRKWKSGCFAQNPVEDWWLRLPVAYELEESTALREAVGLELGLKDTVATSDGEKLEAGNFYRRIEQKIAQAQRCGHKRQAKRLHRRPARRRKDALHKSSRKIADTYQTIMIGYVTRSQAGQDSDGQISTGRRLGHAQDATPVPKARFSSALQFIEPDLTPTRGIDLKSVNYDGFVGVLVPQLKEPAVPMHPKVPAVPHALPNVPTEPRVPTVDIA